MAASIWPVSRKQHIFARATNADDDVRRRRSASQLLAFERILLTRSPTLLLAATCSLRTAPLRFVPLPRIILAVLRDLSHSWIRSRRTAIIAYVFERESYQVRKTNAARRGIIRLRKAISQNNK